MACRVGTVCDPLVLSLFRLAHEDRGDRAQPSADFERATLEHKASVRRVKLVERDFYACAAYRPHELRP
jgi:hypothetical protein